MKIAIINGPNLNLLGVREPGIYGTESFEVFFEKLVAKFPSIEFDYFQSNVEGELINKIQEVGFSVDGIILNAGGYTHTSVALSDAVAAVTTPTVEVHISNLYKREEFRHQSYVSKRADASIIGMGVDGYSLCMRHMGRLLTN